MALIAEDDKGPKLGATSGELAFYACCRLVAVGASRLYLPGKVRGRQHLPAAGPFVIAPVHRSYVDWLVVARVTRRRLRYIVKGEVWRSRAAGRLLGALGAFPVRRDAPDREAMRTALAVLSGGEPLVVFPEGTRRSGALVEDLREGAAYLALRAGVPIVPVGIAGTEAAMGRGRRVPRPCRVEIVIGAALAPVRRLGEDRAERRVSRAEVHRLNEQLQAAMQEVFDEATRRLASSPGTARRPLAPAPPARAGRANNTRG